MPLQERVPVVVVHALETVMGVQDAVIVVEVVMDVQAAEPIVDLLALHAPVARVVLDVVLHVQVVHQLAMDVVEVVVAVVGVQDALLVPQVVLGVQRIVELAALPDALQNVKIVAIRLVVLLVIQRVLHSVLVVRQNSIYAINTGVFEQYSGIKFRNFSIL